MRYVLLVLLLVLLAGVRLGVAQHLPDDPRTKDAYRLELKYVEDIWKACRQNVADLWERGNVLEQEAQRLREENKRLKEENAALKPAASAKGG